MVMLIHTFQFRFKPEATQADVDRALTEIRGFKGQVPGLLEVYLGRNVSERSNGYTFGAVMHFADREAFKAYDAPSAVHGALLAWLGPLVEAQDVDFET